MNWTELQRLRKEGRYSALNKNTMVYAKSCKVYKTAKNIAEGEGINTQKNYYFSLLKMTLSFAYLVQIKEYPPQAARQIMFQYLNENLKETIKAKYSKTNTQSFMNLVYQKNLHDLKVFFQLFGTKDPFSINEILKKLYDQTAMNQHDRQRNLLAKIYLDHMPIIIQKEDDPVSTGAEVQENGANFDSINYRSDQIFLEEPQSVEFIRMKISQSQLNADFQICKPSLLMDFQDFDSEGQVKIMESPASISNLSINKQRTLASYGEAVSDAVIQNILFKFD